MLERNRESELRIYRELDADLAVLGLIGDPVDGGGNASILYPGETLESKSRGLRGTDATERVGWVELGDDSYHARRYYRRQTISRVNEGAFLQWNDLTEPSRDGRTDPV